MSKLYLLLFTVALCVFVGCSQEENVSCSPSKSYEELSISISDIGVKYAKTANSLENYSSNLPKKKKVWWWLGRIFTTVIADVGGSFSSGSTGTTWNIKQGIDCSKMVWDEWADEPKKPDSLKPVKCVAAKDTMHITMNKEAIPPLQGRLLSDNAGYVHNKVLINLYEKYGDEMNFMSASESTQLISEEYEKVIKEANLTVDNNTADDVDLNAIYRIRDLAKKSEDTKHFIELLKEEYPDRKEELNILGLTIENIMNGQIQEDDLNSYNKDILNTIDESDIPDDSKKLLKTTVSVANGSSQLWCIQ